MGLFQLKCIHHWYKFELNTYYCEVSWESSQPLPMSVWWIFGSYLDNYTPSFREKIFFQWLYESMINELHFRLFCSPSLRCILLKNTQIVMALDGLHQSQQMNHMLVYAKPLQLLKYLNVLIIIHLY